MLLQHRLQLRARPTSSSGTAPRLDLRPQQGCVACSAARSSYTPPSGVSRACRDAPRVQGFTSGFQRVSGAQAARRSVATAAAATASTEELADEIRGEDFYSLLGVSPKCSTAEVKAAYRGLMRDLHPDLALSSQDEEMKDQAHMLAVLLNEIYDTLMDEEKRATYNMLSGFATDHSVNPFEDTSGQFARDQAFVDEVSCIGCQKCVRSCPKTFEIEDSIHGRARVYNQNGESKDEIQIATEICPVSCIHWVTLPQLPLLEEALSKIPRIDAFILKSGGAGGNVFWEAYKAYERRRLAINEKATSNARSQQRQQQSSWPFTNMKAGGSSSSAQQQQQQQQPSTGEERRIMNLAAIAARASRLWHQNGNSIRKPKAELGA